MTRKPYPSDLKDAEWAVLKPLLPPNKPIGSPREVELREVVNALMYVADNGIKWLRCPMIFWYGRRCMGTSGTGHIVGCGRQSIKPWVGKSGPR